MQPFQDLFRHPKGVCTCWASFENPTARKGAAGQANRGAKGCPSQTVARGETVTLLDVAGSGIVNRIWLTIRDRHPEMLRSVRVDMYWDSATTPAVSAPLGDFFGVALGRRVAFECELFSDPEGRSFNCFIPMPFRQNARITITNESDMPLYGLFYDVNFLLGIEHLEDVLYFHAHWRRENPNALGQDYTILPQVHGSGRFLGTNLGVIANPIYQGTWWGEGEVKIWLDGDEEFPTLCATGTEDYIGSAWAQGVFTNRTQGCTLADKEKGLNAFYRYHTLDPIYFDQDCRVTIQTIGSDAEPKIERIRDAGAPMILTSISIGGENIPFLTGEYSIVIGDTSREMGYVNFFRQDDWCSTAYFYLDRAEDGLPQLAAVAERIRGIN